MSSTVQLGSLRLSHLKSQLHIESTVYVTARSSQDSSESDLSAQITSGSAWVCRGVGFQVILDTSFNGQPLDPHFCQHLANGICKADLWKQLGLEATLPLNPSQHEADPGGASGIIIKLAHSSHNASPPTKLLSSIPVKDVKPPDGVNVISLEAVKFLIHVSSTEKRSLKRKRDIEELRFSQPYGHNEDYYGVGRAIAAEGGDGDILMLHNLEDPCFPGEAGRLFTGLTNPSCVDMPVRWQSFSPSRFHNVEPAPMDDQTGNRRAEQHEQDAYDIDRSLELLDAVLRLTICDKRCKAPQLVSGLQVHQDDFSTKLSTFAPSLWSPGYLKAVFLPTITHALSTSLLTNARSKTLKRKIEKLVDHQDIRELNCSGQFSRKGMLTKPVPKTVYKAVSVKLWNILQRQLFDPMSTRHLKALNSTGNTFKDMEEVMLESECIFEDEDMLYWQDTTQSGLSDTAPLWDYEEEELDEDGYDDYLELLHEFDRPETALSSFTSNNAKVELNSVPDSIPGGCEGTEEEENPRTNMTFRLDDNTSDLSLEDGMWLGGLGEDQTHDNECLVADADILFNIET